MKKCTQCGSIKELTQYQKSKSSKDGYRSNCRPCAYSKTIDWNRSKRGVACRLWHKHNARSATRGHAKPEYSREWLFDFVLNNKDFDRIYSKWVASGYDKMLAPSIDRINDRIGYTKDNIRLVTFAENMQHAWDAAKNKEYDNAGWGAGALGEHRAVKQFSISGEFISEYKSVSEACRVTGASDSKICAVCKGDRLSHKGFQWRYSNEEKPVYSLARKVINSGGIAANTRKVSVSLVDKALVGVFDSVADACRRLGLNYRSVYRAMAKGYSNKGYTFSYESD